MLRQVRTLRRLLFKPEEFDLRATDPPEATACFIEMLMPHACALHRGPAASFHGGQSYLASLP
jgi:hypothetical protein